MLRSGYLRRAGLFALVTGLVTFLVAGVLLWRFERVAMQRAGFEMQERVSRRARVLDVVNVERPTPHPSGPAQNASDLAMAGLRRGMDLAPFQDSGHFFIVWRARDGIGYRELSSDRKRFGPLQAAPSTPDSPFDRGLSGETGVAVWRVFQDEPAVTAFSPVHGQQLALVGSISIAEVHRPLWQAAEWALSLGVFLILAVSAFYVWITSGLERSLDAQWRQLRTILDALPQRVFVKDREQRYVFVNQSFTRDRQATPAQFIGKRAEEAGIFTPDMVARIQALDRNVLETNQGVNVARESFPALHGGEEVLRLSRIPILDRNGRLEQFVGVSEDITAVTKYQREAESAQRLMQLLVDAVPAIIGVKDVEGRYLTQNRAMRESYAAHSLPNPMETGALVFGSVDPNMRDKARELHEEVVRTRNTVLTPEYPIKFPDGSERTYFLTQSPMLDPQGQVVAVAAIWTDITDLKAARAEADESQRMLKALFDSIPHFVFVRDLEGRFLTVNRAMREYYAKQGLPDPIDGARSSFGSVDPAVRDQSRMLHQRVVEAREPVVVPEVSFLEPAGAKRTVHFVQAPVFDADGKVMAVAGVSTDITELKRAQAELNRIFELSPDVQLVAELNGTFRQVSPAVERILGYTAGELLAQPYNTVIHPDDEALSATFRQEARSGKTVRYENRYRSKNGTYRWLAWQVVYDSGTGLIYASGRDITEERERKEALAESELRFSSVIAAMGEGLILQRQVGGIAEANAAAERILGASRGALLGADLDTLLAHAQTENGGTLSQAGHPVADVIASGQPRSVFLGVNASDAVARWVVLNVQPLAHAGAEKPYAAVCTLLDVSKRLQAERALTLSEQRFRALFAHAPVGIYEMNVDGQVLTVNERLKSISGLGEAAMLGHQWRSAMHPEDRPRMKKTSHDLASSDRPLGVEFRFIRPDGQTVWVEAVTVALRDKDDRITSYLGAITDLTRRKRAEAAQVQSYNLMSAVSRAQSRYIAHSNFEDLFSYALQDLLLITESTHGVIGEVREAVGGAGDDESETGQVVWKTMIHEHAPNVEESGDILQPLRGLVGRARSTGQPAVLTIPEPDRKSSAAGLTTFAGVPLYHGKRMNALVGLAGRPGGYQDSLFRFLEPLLFTYGAIIQALHNDRRRRDAEASIAQKNQQLESIFANMAEGIVILDRSGRVSQVNRLTRSMMDWGEIPQHGPEDLAQVFKFRFRDGRPYPLEEMAMVRALRERQTIIGQQVTMSRPWGDVALLVSASPVFDEQHEVSGAVAILSDITELKQLDELKSEFISTVSHELRTPLAAILGYVELVLEGDTGEITADQRRYLEIVSRNTTRLTQLINNLLDIEKIETGKSKINRAVVSISDLLLDVVATFRVVAEHKGLQFAVGIDPNLSIVGDHDRLIQVFSNFLSNAIKYTRQGEVRLLATGGGAEVRITVADTGIGLTTDDLGKLFTKFYRADDDYTRQAGGTGLGLVISRAIVAQHTGRIEVSSVHGEGTEFRVFFPSVTAGHPAKSPPAGSDSPEAPGSESATVSSGGVRGRAGTAD